MGERGGAASEARKWKPGFRLTRCHGLCGMGTVPSCSVPLKMSEVECQRSWNNGERKGRRRLPRGSSGVECQGWSGEEEVVGGKLGEQWGNGRALRQRWRSGQWGRPGGRDGRGGRG